MQNITESEFQREVEALKSHRRISVNRPLLDPDLPEIAVAHGGGRDLFVSEDGSSSHSSSSSNGLGGSPSRGWGPTGGVSLSDDGPSTHTGSLVRRSKSAVRPTFSARRRGAGDIAGNGGDEASGPSISEGGASDVTSSNDDVPLNRPLDPSHLFWVPASMHPEISPSDFRKFLHDHASRAVREQNETQESVVGPSGQRSPTSPTGLSPSPVDALKHRSTSIARRGSTLRRQYQPENDDEQDITSSRDVRNKRTLSQRTAYSSRVPDLSIDDLQKLERLAEEASNSSDPSELRSVLRRTMSLNVSPSALDQVDAVPPENEQDAPLIVPRPGQILRRAARTKIRKSSFSTDGPGMGSRRRRGPAGSGNGQQVTEVPDRESPSAPNESKRESSTSEPSDESTGVPFRPQSEGATESVLDIYSRDSYLSDDTQRTSVTSLTESLAGGRSIDEQSDADRAQDLEVEEPAPLTPTQQSISGKPFSHDDSIQGYFGAAQPATDDGTLKAEPYVPQEANYSHGQQADESFASTSKSTIKPVSVQHVPPVPSFEKTRPAPQPPAQASAALQPADLRSQAAQPTSAPPAVSDSQGVDVLPHAGQRLVKSDTMPNLSGQTAPSKPAKEKKSAFGLHWLSSWTKDDDGEKPGKKGKKERKEREKERGAQEQSALGNAHLPSRGEKEREKDSSGFLGSLFGKKKGHDEGSRHEYGSHLYGAATGMTPITAGSLLDMRGKGGMGHAYYHRYPIHIERAVYRLSHIKLANPRRPLYEQVLISNLMFWYLSVINRSQQQQQQQIYQAQTQQGHHLQQSPSAGQAHQPAALHHDALQVTQIPEEESQIAQFSQQNLSHFEPDMFGARDVDPVHESALSPHTAIDRDDVSDEEKLESDQYPKAQKAALVPGQKLNPSLGHETGTAREELSDAYSASTSANESPRQAQATGGTQVAKAGGTAKTKRSGLVKPNRAPPGTRSAERAIPAAAYGAQHRQISSEMAHSAAAAAAASIGASNGAQAGNVSPDRLSPSNGPLRITGRHVSGNHSVSADEHAWLGSQRRSPGAEERRSDPLSDSGRSWKDASAGRKTINRVSEPACGTAAGRDADRPDDDAGHGVGTISAPKGWTTQPSGPNGSQMLYNGHAHQDDRLDASSEERNGKLAFGDDPNLLFTGSKEASAMLDAARLSQSRRR